MSEALSARPAPPARLRSLVLSPRARYLLTLGLVVAAYYGAAKIGYAFSFAGPVAAIDRKSVV